MRAPSPTFDNSILALPAGFYEHVAPAPLTNPELVRLNLSLCNDLGLSPEWLKSPQGIEMLAGSRLPKGAASIALAYTGHQFGNLAPRLGDGRALLIGELIDSQGKRKDLQLKGSGRTPYSRGGDGRSPLGPVLREYLVSEAMHALGVPTTRSLAAVVARDRVARRELHPAGVLTRVASSHIRVGSFEYCALRGDLEGLRALCDYTKERHDALDEKSSALSVLALAARGQAELVAKWQSLGFIHGVMNTDNMLVGGETIDYGPCAFMEAFSPNQVYSSIDRKGRYAYANQPSIAQWNLACLANALAPLFASDSERERAKEIIEAFAPACEGHYERGLFRKMGLLSAAEEDAQLAGTFLDKLHKGSVDYTLAFRALIDLVDPDGKGSIQHSFQLPEAFASWIEDYLSRIGAGDRDASVAAMRKENPIIIPRNHLIEAAIVAAEQEQHFCLFHDLVDAVRFPFDSEAATSSFALPAQDHERVTETFCGT